MVNFSYIQINVMNILSERLSFCGYTPMDYLVEPFFYEHDGMAKEVTLTVYVLCGKLVNPTS